MNKIKCVCKAVSGIGKDPYTCENETDAILGTSNKTNWGTPADAIMEYFQSKYKQQ